LVYFCCEFLARLQFVDEGFVHEDFVDASLGFGEGLQDGVFDVEELFLVGGVLLYDFCFLLFQVGVFDCDDLCQHLFFESAWGDGEVDDGDLHEGFGGVVGIGDGGGHEEFERVVVRQGFITDLDYA
jgi:hypothetical protein